MTAGARQGDPPILCQCRRGRLGLLGDHRNWGAEYRRNRAAGRVADDVHFAIADLEGRIDPAEVAA